MPTGTNGPEIVFDEETHPNTPVPQSQSDVQKMKQEQLLETGNIISYALQHGSGATVRLAFPLAYIIAQCAANGEKDLVSLVQQFEQEGQSARYGRVNVNW